MSLAVGPGSRPDESAYEFATSLSFPDLVQELEGLLGARIVAEIAAISETRAVREWAQGERGARPPIPQRLRTALRIALFIADNSSSEIAQAWFEEPDPRLDDCEPIEVLRTSQKSARQQVLASARAFVSALGSPEGPMGRLRTHGAGQQS